MNYRLLEKHEWCRVEEKVYGYGKTPKEGLIAVADDGDIRAALCLQPILHCEPIWIEEVYRGVVDPRKLHKTLIEYLPSGLEYYAFTPDRRIRLIAGSFGMKPQPWGVWKGVV